MSKRTYTSPFIVEQLREDGTWFVHSYELNERLAKKMARNFVKFHSTSARVRRNPNISNDPTVIYKISPDII